MSDASKRGRPLLLVGPTWLVLGVLFLAPLAIVLLTSFARRGPYGAFAPIGDVWLYLRSGAFMANYARSFDRLYLLIFWRSLWMAVLTTALTLVVSYPAAYYIALVAPARRKNLLLALAVIPFWTSFLVRTYAWMLILRAEGLLNTTLLGAGLIDHPLDLLFNNFSVTLGLIYGELPFMILPLYASIEKLDRTLLEAASDLGAGRRSTFWRVTVPMTAPGIAAGAVLVFIPSIGQFVVSDVLGGGKVMLVGNLIQNQFGSSMDPPFGSAIAFELMVLVLALLLGYAVYARRRGEDLL
ncbi:MAG: ABC transporter permease [Planctomycetes bacterium]|nr:ABC transporter permease [Planctomycetota bacterium]